MSKPQVLETVEPRERVTVTHANYAGDVQKLTEPDQYLVQRSKCDHKSDGYWICATHKICFNNQFGKDTHIHEGKHRLAWFCRACNAVQVP